MLCFKERSPQKKKYSNLKVREENIAVVYLIIHLGLWSLQLEKFILVTSFFSLPLGGVGCVGESWLLTHTWQIADWDRTGLGLGTFNEPVLTTAFNFPKSPDLFSYIEILGNKSKIPECSMSPVKLSWNTWKFICDYFKITSNFAGYSARTR